MKIGIIGAGQIGGTLTRRLRALGHEVHVANSRDPRTLASLVTETGAVAVEAKDAPRGVDLVIVTIPERNVPTLPKGLPACQQAWSSWIPATTIRASAMAGL
jgi:predicted dinucleotide-binding enzyme